jgi:hypothetical protein
VASIASHIQFATDNAGGRTSGPFAGRPPLLHRVGRGRYLRYRAGGADGPRRAPASGRVLLVGSSGAVATAPRVAAELFESPGFAAARERAVRSGSRWFVLSARYGLLDPDEVVSPAEDQLGDHTLGYRIAWGEWVGAQLAERLWLSGVVVEVHGGVDFAQPLRQPLGRRGAGVELPLPRMWQDEPDADPEEAGRADDEDLSPARAAAHRLRDLVRRHGSDGGDRRHA